ncbi:MAG: hypothetical protein HY072_08620, partial [Deltaproteobacteria bacterium]|nr:hypothetical protein [Deltaproteobacteria bacterium]
MIFKTFFLTICFFVCAAGYSDETIRGNIEKQFNLFKSNPNSCEAVYYGIFTDGKIRKDYYEHEGKNLLWYEKWNNKQEAQENNTSLDKVRDVFYQIQGFFGSGISDFLQLKSQLRSEWQKRLYRTQVRLNGDSNEKSCFMYFDENSNTNSIDDPANPCEKYKAEQIGENYAGKPIITLAPRQTPMLLWSGIRLRAIPSRSANCLKLPTSIKAIDPPEAKFKHTKMSTEELEDMFRKLQMPSSFDEILKRYEKDNEFSSGEGTENIQHFVDLLKKGNIKEAQEELSNMHSSLHQQVTESFADLVGTKIVTAFIKKVYQTPEDRKKAALAVLAQ